MKSEISRRESNPRQEPLTERLLVLQKAEGIINSLGSDIVVPPLDKDNPIKPTNNTNEGVVISNLESTRRSVEEIYGQTN